MKLLKRTAAFLIAAIMVLALSTVVFADLQFDEDGNIIENEPLPGGIITLGAQIGSRDVFRPVTGEVVELMGGAPGEAEVILIAFEHENGELGHAEFLIDYNTFFLGERPELGDVITGFFQENVPILMIYPPQYLAIAIVNLDSDLPFVTVARFDENMVSYDGLRRLRITEDTEIVLQGGDPFDGELIGRKLVVEYTVSHRDIPETVFADRVTVLYERIMPLDELEAPPAEIGNRDVFGSVTGEVVDFRGEDGQFIRVEFEHEDGQPGQADFRIDDNTFFLGGRPEAGDVVTGFFQLNVPMIMIYPPQYLAIAIVNLDDDLPFVTVARFDENLVSYDGLRRLNITDETEIVLQGGDPFDGEIIGRKLVVEYTVSHRDMPETIFAERITVLYERIAIPLPLPIDVPELTGVPGGPPEGAAIAWPYNVMVEGMGIPTGSYAIVGDSILPNFLSFRAVIDQLGFGDTIVWNGELREISVNNADGDVITFRIDAQNVSVVSSDGGSTSVTLDEAPVLIRGLTYVPFAFFREFFGMTNVYFEGGIVFVDSGELME